MKRQLLMMCRRADHGVQLLPESWNLGHPAVQINRLFQRPWLAERDGRRCQDGADHREVQDRGLQHTGMHWQLRETAQ